MVLTPLVGSSTVLFTKIITFLQKNKTASQKYLLVVNSSSSASDIIISTGESVMSIGGFLGSDKIVTLAQIL